MVETRAFGLTGHGSTRVVFGAAALGAMSPSRAEATLAKMDELGVNHIDTAADYGDSEIRLAPFLAANRGRFFLATKTGARAGAGARAGLERSLERMGVDHVDLIQLHNLVEEDEWEVAFSAGGAVEALFAARDEGLCHHVGVTGHGLRIARMHLRSLDEAPFASVLAPWNHSLAAIDRYATDFEELVSVCTDRGVAVQTIKSAARRRWTDDDAEPRFSWYEPIRDADALTRAVRFVLADPRLFLITSSDARLLSSIVAAGSGLVEAPEPSALAADREVLDIAPLFDGAELELI